MVFTQGRGCRRWKAFRWAESIASVEFPLVQTRDRLRCLATGVGVGRIFRSSMSFSSVEFGDVKTFRCVPQMVDLASFERSISEVETGMMFINQPTNRQEDLPFGGIKHSGYGRELSYLGIREFVNKKLIHMPE